MGLVILGLMVGSFLISLGLTAVIKKVAVRVGFVDKPGFRKIHYIPKALGGGIAILLAMGIPMVGGLLFVHFSDPPKIVTTEMTSAVDVDAGSGRTVVHPTTITTTTEDHPLAKHWPGIRHQTPLALKFLLAMVAMHVLGVVEIGSA